MQNKIHTHTNNGKAWLLVEVLEMATDIQYHKLFIPCNPCITHYVDEVGTFKIKLPSGVCAEPKFAKDLSESEWSEIVHRVYGMEKIQGIKGFCNYLDDSSYCDSLNSGLSLLQSILMKPETTVIIQKLT